MGNEHVQDDTFSAHSPCYFTPFTPLPSGGYPWIVPLTRQVINSVPGEVDQGMMLSVGASSLMIGRLSYSATGVPRFISHLPFTVVLKF